MKYKVTLMGNPYVEKIVECQDYHITQIGYFEFFNTKKITTIGKELKDPSNEIVAIFTANMIVGVEVMETGMGVASVDKKLDN